jgi:archaeal flagellar protein FlaJ
MPVVKIKTHIHVPDLSDMRSLVKTRGIIPVTVASLISGIVLSCALLMFQLGPDIALYGGLVVSLLPVAYAYRAVSIYDSEVEAKAPEFFYDLSEQVKASGSIIKALKRVSRHDYGIISDEVRSVLSEIEEEGYGVASALAAMAGRVNNRYIDRSVSVIKEALTTSSNLESILKTVAGEGRLSLSLKKERLSGISSSVFVIYFTAIIFLAVTMLCITSFMHMANEMRLASGVDEMLDRASVMPYYVLSVSVAICTGLTIGEMRDCTVLGGFKDAAIILTLTFAVYELVIFPGYNLLGAYGL